MAEIKKETIIADVLNIIPNAAPVFMSYGMGCLGCAVAHGETIEEACAVHGVDCEALLSKLNEMANA